MSRFRYDRSPSMKKLTAGTARWWIVFTVLFFVLFPFTGPAAVKALAFVLDGLNNFGSGY